MKKLLISLTAAGLLSMGSIAQAGDAAAGQAAYASCIGCHGAAGEGGVGPKLASVAPAETVDKLKKGADPDN